MRTQLARAAEVPGRERGRVRHAGKCILKSLYSVPLCWGCTTTLTFSECVCRAAACAFSPCPRPAKRVCGVAGKKVCGVAGKSQRMSHSLSLPLSFAEAEEWGHW